MEYDLYQSVLNNLVVVCFKLRDFNAIIKYANRGIEINNLFANFFYFRAVAYFKISEIEKADQDIEFLENLLPDEEKKKGDIKTIRNIINKKKKR